MTDVRLTALNPVDSQVYPVACNSSGELLVSGGTPPAGGGSFEYISTSTVTTATSQVDFDLSDTTYESFVIKAYGCKFTAAPINGYCVFFTFWQGTYDPANPSTGKMSTIYQRFQNNTSTVATTAPWSSSLTLFTGWQPTINTKFGFDAQIGGKYYSPIYIQSAFLDGTSTASAAPAIYGVCPNASNNLVHMTVKPSTTTFAAGTFCLYGIKNS